VGRPRNRNDVAAALAFCREHGTSITARGGGTSQAGQAIGAGLQLDFSKHFSGLLELQPDHQRVRVQPGIVLDELNATLKPYGLTLPLDLSTSSRATIGGMISNNSAGTRSVVYGKTIDYVESLTVMLADGSVVVLDDSLPSTPDTLHARCHEAVLNLANTHSAEIGQRYPQILRRVGGYNLDEFTPDHQRPPNLSRLIVGSEGTLALILEATLRVVPTPTERILLSVQFDDLLEALAAVPAILDHNPSAIELVDRMILSHTIRVRTPAMVYRWRSSRSPLDRGPGRGPGRIAQTHRDDRGGIETGGIGDLFLPGRFRRGTGANLETPKGIPGALDGRCRR
jgi:FAD/FMN-containing dehydrogenase